MDEDRRELGRRLCVLATEIAETAHDAAVTGQAPSATAAELSASAAQLAEYGAAQRTIADLLNVIARLGRRMKTDPVAD